ncbi:hypothetical protein [Saccharopolyspora rectivirgula]|uniref:hypothetical protein n=1 Tax=Saccharopolyspora rectivirgula TaxID=28042 RepID=UPI0004089F12|nr:hypothetical protein [Saccharopolyspora rectivirgula]
MEIRNFGRSSHSGTAAQPGVPGAATAVRRLPRPPVFTRGQQAQPRKNTGARDQGTANG